MIASIPFHGEPFAPRVLALALFLTCNATLATAGSDPAADRLAACAEEKDERRRLACFDREIPSQKPRATPAPAQANAPPPAPPRVSTPPPPAAPAAVPSLGDEQLRGKARPPAEAAAELNARVTDLRKADGSSMLVTLDNGQVWRLQNLELASYLKKGDAVTISKGTLGAYRLTRDEGHDKNWIRALRVR